MHEAASSAAPRGGGAVEVITLPSGALTARVGSVWLEDPRDPAAGAEAFLRPEQAEGVELVVLVGGGTGHRVEHLRRLGVPKVVVVEPLAELRALAHGPLAPVFRGCWIVHRMDELAACVRKTLARPNATRLVSSRGYAELFPGLLAECAEPVRQGLAAAEELFDTGRHRALLGTEQLAGNVRRLPGKVSAGALAASRPLAGRPAFLVSAGPSLDRNVGLLAEAAKRGPIFAVNTAARAVEHAGGAVDVLVALEPLPLGDQLSASARAVLCDVSTHPTTLDAPVDPKLVSFGSRRGEHLEKHLGLPHFETAGSVATYAVQAALNLGADPIVLLGQDCAFPDGRMYASHCQRDMWRARVVGDEVHLDVDEELWRLFTDHDIPELRTDPLVELPAWGGEGKVASIGMFANIGRVLMQAARAATGTRLINATEGGASLEGWEERRLADVLAELPERPHGLHEAIAATSRLGAADAERLRDTLRRELRAVERAAEQTLMKKGRARDVAGRRREQAAAATPLVRAHALRELVALEREPPRDRARQTVRLLRRSAKRLARLL
ncbi:MAG: 6-hydroxymethylpterin diphosphokinase MptE-like protein [Myxococcota bacterium]